MDVQVPEQLLCLLRMFSVEIVKIMPINKYQALHKIFLAAWMCQKSGEPQ
jgi:hypothetical protein